jgi:hypothetical protein
MSPKLTVWFLGIFLIAVLCDLVLVGRAVGAESRAPCRVEGSKCPSAPPTDPANTPPVASPAPPQRARYTFKDAVIEACNLDSGSCRFDPKRAELAYVFRRSATEARDLARLMNNEQNKGKFLRILVIDACESYLNTKLLDDISIVFTTMDEKNNLMYSFSIDRNICDIHQIEAKSSIDF